MHIYNDLGPNLVQEWIFFLGLTLPLLLKLCVSEWSAMINPVYTYFCCVQITASPACYTPPKLRLCAPLSICLFSSQIQEIWKSKQDRVKPETSKLPIPAEFLHCLLLQITDLPGPGSWSTELVCSEAVHDGRHKIEISEHQ